MTGMRASKEDKRKRTDAGEQARREEERKRSDAGKQAIKQEGKKRTDAGEQARGEEERQHNVQHTYIPFHARWLQGWLEQSSYWSAAGVWMPQVWTP